ncbi:MAG: hypothetical protein ACF8MJ_09755 [Phycisphaerales bacterium JB050]
MAWGAPSAADLVDQLRADDTRWNAMEAMDALGRLREPPIEELERALDSEDWQQRQIAAVLRWRYIDPGFWLWGDDSLPAWRLESTGTVTRRLLEVTVEGLRDDALPFDEENHHYTFVANAVSGYRALVVHAEAARDLLEAGLESDDYQQKLMCALILGAGGVSDSVDKVAPILIPHLRDNDINEDAKHAIYSLYRFGESVVPYLEAALPRADEQQGQAIRLLLLDLRDKPQTQADLEARKRMHRITEVVHDPCLNMVQSHFSWLYDIKRSQWLADRGEIPQPPKP